MGPWANIWVTAHIRRDSARHKRSSSISGTAKGRKKNTKLKWNGIERLIQWLVQLHLMWFEWTQSCAVQYQLPFPFPFTTIVFFHHPGPTKAPKKSSAFNVFVGWTSRTSPFKFGQNPKGSSNDLVLSREVSPPTQIPDFILHDHHISETLTDIFSASCKLGLVPCLSGWHIPAYNSIAWTPPVAGSSWQPFCLSNKFYSMAEDLPLRNILHFHFAN